MSTMHTPGPWFARKDPNSLDDDDWCVGTGPENIDKVAVCSSWDAHLIAAAPELLEAAKLVLEWYEAEDNHSGTDFYQRMQMCRDSEDAVRAAIAKATGEPA